MRRYESKGGKYWIEVDEDIDDYGLVNYTSGSPALSGGGRTSPEALRARIARGDFQADANITPMREVRVSDDLREVRERVLGLG